MVKEGLKCKRALWKLMGAWGIKACLCRDGCVLIQIIEMCAALPLFFFLIVVFLAIASMLLGVWQWWNGLKCQSLNQQKGLDEGKKWCSGNWASSFSSWIVFIAVFEGGEAELELCKSASRLGSSWVPHVALKEVCHQRELLIYKPLPWLQWIQLKFNRKSFSSAVCAGRMGFRHTSHLWQVLWSEISIQNNGLF